MRVILPRERMSKGQFTLRDLYKQLQGAMKLGPMGKVMGMIPGMGEMAQVCNERSHTYTYAVARRKHGQRMKTKRDRSTRTKDL